MRPLFRSTTALVASFAAGMAGMPPLALAQEAGDATLQEVCPEGLGLVIPDDMTEEEVLARIEAGEDPDCEPADAAEAEMEAEADTETEAEAEVTEDAAESEAEPEAEMESEADMEPAEEAPAAEAEAEAEAEVEAEAEMQVEEEPAPEAAAEMVEDEPDPEADADMAGEETEEQPEVEMTEEDAGAEVEMTEEDAGSETEGDMAAEVVDPEADADAEAEVEMADEATEAEGDAPEMAESAEAEVVNDPAADPAPAPLAASAEAEAEGEVQIETVTEDTARSSDEEFAETEEEADVAAASAESAAAPAAEEEEGLSDIERALLIGAGAIAVGAILSGGREVVSATPDRVVVERQDGSLDILRDDNALLRQPGNRVETVNFADGSSRTTVTRPDGVQIVTIRDAELRVVRRVRIGTDGSQVVLIDDVQAAPEPVVISTLPEPRRDQAVEITDDTALRAALLEASRADRTFSLAQVRAIPAVRLLAPAINLDNITFETGSAAIAPTEAEELLDLGRLLNELVAENPAELFLIEGHTDAVGSAASNLTLSDRRAETVALALTEYFAVPPENLVVQGFGETQLLIDTQDDERANRRAVVRRITPLLDVAAN